MVVVVEPLGSHPELVLVAAEWHFSEWGHTDPGGSAEAWAAAMARQAAQAPGMLIALADGSPAGVVGLVAHDMPGYRPAAALTPWVKGLYVSQPHRRRGVGTLLMRRCEALAASLSHQVLYLYTERGSPAQALYERLGWQTIHVGRYDGIDVTVMRTLLPMKSLTADPAQAWPRARRTSRPGRRPHHRSVSLQVIQIGGYLKPSPSTPGLTRASAA